MMMHYVNARHGHTPMTVESLLIRRIHTKSSRYDKIRGFRMAYTVVNGGSIHDVRARLKLKRALQALREFQQLRARLGWRQQEPAS